MQFIKMLGVLVGTTLLFTAGINNAFAGRYHYQHQASSCHKCACNKHHRDSKCTCKNCHCNHSNVYGHYQKNWRGKHTH